MFYLIFAIVGFLGNCPEGPEGCQPTRANQGGPGGETDGAQGGPRGSRGGARGGPGGPKGHPGGQKRYSKTTPLIGGTSREHIGRILGPLGDIGGTIKRENFEVSWLSNTPLGRWPGELLLLCCVLLLSLLFSFYCLYYYITLYYNILYLYYIILYCIILYYTISY